MAVVSLELGSMVLICFFFFFSNYVTESSVLFCSVLGQCSDEWFFLLVFRFCFIESILICLDEWMDRWSIYFSLENPASYGANLADLIPYKFVSICSHVIPKPASIANSKQWLGELVISDNVVFLTTEKGYLFGFLKGLCHPACFLNR